MTLPTDQLERLAVDTIRTLSIDGVQQANSGHPGAPMGMAPMTFALWTKHLRHAPTDPAWPNRDRFVLSAGHASMLLYSMLHLTGYAVSLDDLKSFRQWGSITPGHPEYGMTPGVEATTGPLGQGLVNGVGMAIAERRLAGEFNRPGHEVIDHRTYVICSDGDLQEGITAEAASLAGHLKLGKLIALYDDNRIQLDGPTAWTFTEDVVARFDAYGWHTQRVDDGNDVAAINAAIEAAKADDRPSLIAVHTTIGYGSPNKAGSQKAHGAPLGPDEVRLTKEAYGWDPDKTFFVPEEAGELFLRAVDAGKAARGRMGCRPRRLRRRLPGRGRRAAPPRRRPPGGRLGRRAQRLRDRIRGRDPQREPGPDPVARRPVPELFGGSADLSESNLTDVKALGHDHFEAAHAGRNIRFGVREHAMGGIANGIAYHGGFLPYCATFMTFSDYMRGLRPDRGAVEPPRGLRLDPRLRGPRRGRPDPPAGRALRRPARDPEPVVRPPGRRERDRRGLGARGGAAVDRRRDERPGGPGAHPPEAADPAGHDGARARGRPPGRVRPARGRGRHAGADPDRDGLGAAPVLRRRRGPRGRRHAHARREPPLLGALRGPGRGVPRQRSCPPP